MRVIRWAEIAEEIRAAIRSGELQSGAALPSAHDDARARGVSVTTIQTARASLIADGWLRAVSGSGTFVAERQLQEDHELSGMSRDVRDLREWQADAEARIARLEALVLDRSHDPELSNRE